MSTCGVPASLAADAVRGLTWELVVQLGSTQLLGLRVSALALTWREPLLLRKALG